MTTPLILHGSTAQPQNLATADQFATLTSVKQAVVQTFWSMMQSGQYTPFPLALADSLWSRGQLYLHTWATYDWRTNLAWPPIDILAGKHDPYLTQQAALIANWKHPLFVRLNHEFNGPWEAWFWPPDDFVAVWQHVVSLFRQQGATNVTWVWCPTSATPFTAPSLADFYPGDSYVDWTGFDQYNWGAIRNVPWQSFAQLADLTYATLQQIAPSKPVFLAEFNSAQSPGSKSQWLTDTLATIPTRYPQIRAVNLYPVPGSSNWPLSPTEALAYATTLKQGPYAQTGAYPLPDDLTTIKPLQSASWGLPVDLGPQLVQAAQQLAIADTVHTADSATHTIDLDRIAELTFAVGHAQGISDALAEQLKDVQSHIRALIAAGQP